MRTEAAFKTAASSMLHSYGKRKAGGRSEERSSAFLSVEKALTGTSHFSGHTDNAEKSQKNPDKIWEIRLTEIIPCNTI
ncbi:hypothetical protein [Lachnoclostridium sp. An169]|uniref:hypothetical protein n=1 Tax=Lachnoclostridium sp. An169 TaxID=1965569 RepID=UPI001122D226|nr:hypothetical protein [Lachnoclostridium sp. An169]